MICPHGTEIGMPFTNVSASGKKRVSLRQSFKDLSSSCDLQEFSVDSTIVKVHQDADSKKKEMIGKSRGGNTIKIHTATDTSGRFRKLNTDRRASA